MHGLSIEIYWATNPDRHPCKYHGAQSIQIATHNSQHKQVCILQREIAYLSSLKATSYTSKLETSPTIHFPDISLESKPKNKWIFNQCPSNQYFIINSWHSSKNI